jgi:FtsP/CotA-like multicopper oxidase with cupredoxin domain
MDNAFDGSQTTQKEMQPGETFAYKLKFPDAGAYWYHPHVRDDYAQEMGLYGMFIVVPTDAQYWDPVNMEIPLFLDDILIEDGAIQASDKGENHHLMGRYGNIMLTNGETDYKLAVGKGDVVRLYMTNAANSRPFNVAIANARMKIVGGDNGAYEQDVWKDEVLIGPSERIIVEVLFDTSGTFAIQNKTPDKTYTFGNIVVTDTSTKASYATEFSQLKTHADTIKSIDPFRSYFDNAPDKRIALTIEMGGAGGHTMSDGTMMNGSMTKTKSDGIEWEDANTMMNAMSSAAMVKWHIVDQDTGKRDMDIDWNFKKGTPVKIRIFNDPKSAHPMQHPIHFHGQRFLVVSRDGVRQTNLVWKDTVLVKAGETVDIVLDTSNPGVWMAHCHILEHIEAGMMMNYKVQ